MTDVPGWLEPSAGDNGVGVTGGTAFGFGVGVITVILTVPVGVGVGAEAGVGVGVGVGVDAGVGVDTVSPAQPMVPMTSDNTSNDANIVASFLI
jgi:hypothetical protein